MTQIPAEITGRLKAIEEEIAENSGQIQRIQMHCDHLYTQRDTLQFVLRALQRDAEDKETAAQQAPMPATPESVIEEPTLNPEQRVSDRILIALRDGPQTAAELAPQVGRSLNQLGPTLTSLRKAHRIKSVRITESGANVWALVTDPESLISQHEKIVAQFRSAPRTLNEVANAVGCTRQYVGQTLGEFTKAGYAERVGDAQPPLWRIVDNGQS